MDNMPPPRQTPGSLPFHQPTKCPLLTMRRNNRSAPLNTINWHLNRRNENVPKETKDPSTNEWTTRLRKKNYQINIRRKSHIFSHIEFQNFDTTNIPDTLYKQIFRQACELPERQHFDTDKNYFLVSSQIHKPYFTRDIF